MEYTFFQNNHDFNAEIFRRQKWLKNHPDIKADKGGFNSVINVITSLYSVTHLI